MAEACDGWRVEAVRKAAVCPQFGGFSGSPGAKPTTIRLSDAYDPKPQATKTPVRIRPPALRPPGPRPSTTGPPRPSTTGPPTTPRPSTPGPLRTLGSLTPSGTSGTKPTTIRLRDAYDSKPQATKTPVSIRPPTPRPLTPGPLPSTPRPSTPGLRTMSVDDAPAAQASCAWESGECPVNAVAMRQRSKSVGHSLERQARPWSRHQVRFVDALGIELEDVKVFRVGDNPLIPQHVMCRLMMSSEQAFGRPVELSMPYLKPCFPENLSAQPGFLPRLLHQGVCLEQVQCSELGITGTVQVLDLAFEKEVSLQYSFTNWRICTDTAASWVSSVRRDTSGGPNSDVFRFRLPVPPFILEPGAILEFAICYRVNERLYWDNNDGRNYKLSCHSYKLAVPKECEDSMLHFT